MLATLWVHSKEDKRLTAIMSRIIWLASFATMLLGVVVADFNLIDVEPVMKKEQPDFEDDTGNGAVILSGSRGTFSNSTHDGKDKTDITDINFMNAFVSSLSMIVVTELGDKTFFIAAIMAMNHPRVAVFAGAMFALTFMHILSSLFGYVITWIPRIYTFYASSALFAIFGLKMLRDGWKMKPDEGQEELEEVQSDLRRREDNYRRESVDEGAVAYTPESRDDGEAAFKRESARDGEITFTREVDDGLSGSRRSVRSAEEGTAGTRRLGRKHQIIVALSRVFFQAFTMTFLAEWGDRSQIATVVMAAREDVYGVIIGGLLGHFLCTGLAVVGGRMIASRISVRTVTIIGGIIFLIFAVSALIMGP
ncbi:putative divalent cation/proton antiporter TMEM165 isoform X5 [Procambarus clarkii]|uniref:putative divalent cation/proton antiporter TMEM165 isoform X5 n=1 Tax=Procambarus clarkii TaxID=6728 RepID=UPI001E678448|nr:transmembrane protein 165-like isoform X2 [Procambarus clarkii]